MRLRIARLGVLLASVMGLVAGFAPPAEATTVASVVFAGTATVDGGTHNTISYPCFEGLPPLTLPTPEFILGQLCLGLLTGLPGAIGTLTDKGIIPHLTYVNDHNPSGFGFGDTFGCVAAGINVNKLSKLPVEAGLCNIAAGGVVLGHCGLSSGFGTGTLGPDAQPGGGNLQTYDFSFLFFGLGGTLFINGTVTKRGGGTGWLRSVVQAQVDPTGGSCTNLNPLTFIIAGVAFILICTATC